MRTGLRPQGVAVALLIGALLGACGGGGAKGDLTGTVNGDGSSTVFLVTEAVAEEFRAQQPDVDVTVGIGGTGGGFKKFCNGETDLQNASRPIKDEEKAECAENGVEYVELTVASDGLAILVNPENDWIDCITTAELKEIWKPGSTVKTWADIRAGFPKREISLYGPGTDSGTFDFFTEAINGEEGASRRQYSPSENDRTLVQGVAGDVGAMGYFGYGYYLASKDELKLLGVDAGKGCVKPSDETVLNGTYEPLSRPLFLYVKKSSAERPEVKAFVDFYLENANEFIPSVGYTPLSEEDLAAEVAEWEAATGA